MTSQLNCHKCPFNGKGSEQCLKCRKDEQTFRFRNYIFDGAYDTIEAPKPHDGNESVTELDPETEDRFRKFLFDIFDLQPEELLMLKSIVNGQTLVDFGRDMERFSKRFNEFSRQRAFQTRKRLLNKLGVEFKEALTTMGQRKELKI